VAAKLWLGKVWLGTNQALNLWIKTTKNSTNPEIKIRGNLGLFFGFSKFMVEITNKSKSVATKSC
jgi:hypothetical protein